MKLMKSAKQTVGLGVASMAGLGILGGMASVPHMPAQASSIVGISSAGLSVLNVGQMIKNTQTIIKKVRR